MTTARDDDGGALTNAPAIPASESLRQIEASLRQLVSSVMTRTLGSDWLSRVVTEQKRGAWLQRLRHANARRLSQGQVQMPESQILEFSELHELKGLLERHWSHFASTLGNRARTIALLDEVESYRNDIAHSRPLLQHQEHLVSGVCGLLRNKVVIALSAQDPSGSHYPSFTFARDGFGANATDLPSDESTVIVSTDLTLRPKDRVTFELEAVDPQGRRLLLTPDSFAPKFDFEPLEVYSGERVRLTWLVEDRHVSRITFVTIRLAAQETPYHRAGLYDQEISFAYRVDPPLS